MAKAEKQKKTAAPSKKRQYERFVEIARKFHVDDEKSAESFELAFKKIVPPKRPQR